MSEYMNILAVGAHPDDIELGCGGALLKHLKRGDNVFVLVMTNGEQGNHALNKQECKSSLSLLSIPHENIIFANFPDGYLEDNQQIVNFIEEIINSKKITRVYTHHPDDRHQDHRNCSNAVSSAARKVPEIFLFQGPSTKNQFDPHYFIEISEELLVKKLEALNFYKTQIDKGIVDLNWIKTLASLHGFSQNKKYAEAFAVNHLLKENDQV
jgi:LmbE family N-acetylglucosaminyl deacetylase